MHRTPVRSWSGIVPEALLWSVSSLSVSDLVAEQPRRCLRKPHPAGMRMHGRSYLVDSSGLAGCCSPPSGTKGQSRPTDEGRTSDELTRAGS